MRQIASLQLFNLRLSLFDGHGFRIIDEQRDNLHLVKVCLPELSGEFRISADRPGILTQLHQSNAEAFQPTGLRLVFLPMRNAPRILIRFQVLKNF